MDGVASKEAETKCSATLRHLEQRWRRGELRAGDRLRARWVMWTLTSTVRRLRDQATRALYWFGRVDPEGLFELTIDSLAVNDAYVGERMLAASYGVVMSHQQADADFAAHPKAVSRAACIGARGVVGKRADAPLPRATLRAGHRRVRGEVLRVRTARSSARHMVVRHASPVQPIAKGDPGADEVGRTLQMDFENYTLGGLFDDRGNYDMDHRGTRRPWPHVRGVAWALGWRAATFRSTGQQDRGGRISARAVEIGPRAERYGKKYGWIGFFTYAGLLEAQGLVPRGRAAASPTSTSIRHSLKNRLPTGMPRFRRHGCRRP